MPDLVSTCNDPDSDDCFKLPAQAIVFWGTIGLVSIGGLLMIFAATEIISKMYHAKRHFKLSMRAHLSLEETSPGSLSKSRQNVDIQLQLNLQVCLSSQKILEELVDFEQKLSNSNGQSIYAKQTGHDGYSFLDLDKFERYLFRKHKSDAVKESQETFCIFSPVTLKRIHAVFAEFTDERINDEAKEVVKQHFKS